jgi:hypothetical protein
VPRRVARTVLRGPRRSNAPGLPDNGLHWVRDVVFAEDSSQVRTAHGPTNLAALRTLAINALRLTGHTNIAAGLRQHARTPLLPLAALGLM